MAERVADGPRSADGPNHFLLSAEAFQSAGVIRSQAVIVPADGAAHLHGVVVDAAGGVVRRRDAAGHPLSCPLLAELRSQRAQAGHRLPFQLHQVQFGDAAFGPQVGRQTHLGELVAVEVEGQTLDGAGTEVPARHDAIGGHTAKRLGHGCCLPMNKEMISRGVDIPGTWPPRQRTVQ